MKKMASPRQAPWLTPSTRTQSGAWSTGAQSDPARPAAVPIRLGTTRARWLGVRCAITGTTSEVARLPTPISASRFPAPTGDVPRS